MTKPMYDYLWAGRNHFVLYHISVCWKGRCDGDGKRTITLILKCCDCGREDTCGFLPHGDSLSRIGERFGVGASTATI
jgi:hypothetical protein